MIDSWFTEHGAFLATAIIVRKTIVAIGLQTAPAVPRQKTVNDGGKAVTAAAVLRQKTVSPSVATSMSAQRAAMGTWLC